MAPCISPDSCNCVACAKARSTSSWAIPWPDNARQAPARIATLIRCRHLLWFPIKKSKRENPRLGKYTIYGFLVTKQIQIRVLVQFHRALAAGSADVFVRNEREARRNGASFARGADEDVRAPSISGISQCEPLPNKTGLWY